MNTATKPLPPHRMTEAEAEALQHDSYLMQIREQSCSHCGSGECWSELFEVWVGPARAYRAHAHVLRPTHTIRAGMPVAYLRLPTVVVPVCSDCIENYNPEMGSVVPALSHTAWAETLKRKYAPEAPKPSGRPETPLENL